jgi:hypothetical protein
MHRFVSPSASQITHSIARRALFRFHRWRANLRILEVEEIKSIPYVPVSHPFVERLIGTIRREFLDHVLIWNAVDLGRKAGRVQKLLYAVSNPKCNRAA